MTAVSSAKCINRQSIHLYSKDSIEKVSRVIVAARRELIDFERGMVYDTRFKGYCISENVLVIQYFMIHSVKI